MGELRPAFALNESLRRRLVRLIRGKERAPFHEEPGGEIEVMAAPDAPADDVPVDVVVTLNEVTHQHGTGPLVQRVLRGRERIFSIRSRNDWGGQDFGHWQVRLPQRVESRPDWFRGVLSALRAREVRQVLCVPYFPDELATAVAIQAAYGARLCAWIMDDQNVAGNAIPDALMREFLERCSLRLTTHPELRYVYERKYGLQFWLLPAVVPAHLIAAERHEEPVTRRCGALLGSFWDQRWFDRTCAVLAESGCAVDWYGNNRSPWLRFPRETMARAGITPLGIVPEEQLPSRLRQYPFVIVPAGELDAEEANAGVAWLSLPGRILFALATAHTPLFILGSEKSCAARFVRHFVVGEVAPYSPARVRETIERLLSPETQSRYRKNAAVLAQRFSDDGVGAWLEESIAHGEPVSRRFEEAFEGYDGSAVARVLPARLWKERGFA